MSFVVGLCFGQLRGEIKFQEAFKRLFKEEIVIAQLEIIYRIKPSPDNVIE